MAADDGIGEAYKITAIRNIGTGRVFSRIRVVRKAKKSSEEEKTAPKPEHKKAEGVDIEA